PRPSDPQASQAGPPSGQARQATRAPTKPVHHGQRQLLPPPVRYGRLIDHIVGVRPPEGLQEVEPALAVGAGEGREQLAADLEAGPVCPRCRAPVSSTST